MTAPGDPVGRRNALYSRPGGGPAFQAPQKAKPPKGGPQPQKHLNLQGGRGVSRFEMLSLVTIENNHLTKAFISKIGIMTARTMVSTIAPITRIMNGSRMLVVKSALRSA